MATLRIDLVVNDDGTAAIKEITGDVEGLGNASEETSKKQTKGNKSAISSFGSMAKQMLAVTGVFAGITTAVASFKDGLEQAIAVETGLAEVSTLVDTQKVSMEGLRDVVMDIGTTYGQEFGKVNKALYDSISAGVDAADAQEFLAAASVLATAGVTDISQSVDQLTSIMNAYQVPASEMASVNDIIFAAVKNGKTTVEELGSSIGKLAPIAYAANLSLEEMYAAVSTVTLGGLSTKEAMTAVRGTLAALIKPSTEAAAKFKELKIDVSSARMAMAEDKGGGFLNVLRDIDKATGGNVEAMAALIPQVEALPAVLALAREDGAKFAEILDDLQNSSGYAQEAFEKMADTTGFKLKQFGAEWDKLKISIINEFLPALAQAVGALTKFTGWLGDTAAPAMRSFADHWKTAFDFSGVYEEQKAYMERVSGTAKEQLGKVKGEIGKLQGELEYLEARKGWKFFGSDEEYAETLTKIHGFEADAKKLEEQIAKAAKKPLVDKEGAAATTTNVAGVATTIVATMSDASEKMMVELNKINTDIKFDALKEEIGFALAAGGSIFEETSATISNEIMKLQNEFDGLKKKGEEGILSDQEFVRFKQVAKELDKTKEGFQKLHTERDKLIERTAVNDAKAAKKAADDHAKEALRGAKERSKAYADQDKAMWKQITKNADKAGAKIEKSFDDAGAAMGDAIEAAGRQFGDLEDEASITGRNIGQEMSQGVETFRTTFASIMASFDYDTKAALATFDSELGIAKGYVTSLELEIESMKTALGDTKPTKAQIAELASLEQRLEDARDTAIDMQDDRTDYVEGAVADRLGLEETGAGELKTLTDTANDHMEQDLKDTWAGGWGAAVEEANKALPTMGELAQATFSDLHTAFRDSFTALIKGDLDSVGAIWDNFWNSLKERFIGTFVDSITNALMNGLSNALSGAGGGGFLDGIIGGLGEMFGGGDLFGSIGDAIGGLFSGGGGVSEIISSIGGGISSLLSGVGGGLASVLGGAASAVSGGLGALVGGAGAALAGVGTAITSGLSSLLPVFAGLGPAGWVAGGIAAVVAFGPKIIDGIGKGISAIGDFAKSAWKSLTGSHKSKQTKFNEEMEDTFDELFGIHIDAEGSRKILKEGSDAFFEGIGETMRGARAEYHPVLMEQAKAFFGPDVRDDFVDMWITNLEQTMADLKLPPEKMQEVVDIMGDAGLSFEEKMTQLGDITNQTGQDIQAMGPQFSGTLEELTTSMQTNYTNLGVTMDSFGTLVDGEGQTISTAFEGLGYSTDELGNLFNEKGENIGTVFDQVGVDVNSMASKLGVDMGTFTNKFGTAVDMSAFKLTGPFSSAIGGIASKFQGPFSGALSALQSKLGSTSNTLGSAFSTLQSKAGGLGSSLSSIQGSAGNLASTFARFRMPKFSNPYSNFHTGKRGDIPKYHSGKVGNLDTVATLGLKKYQDGRAGGRGNELAVIQKREWVQQPEQIKAMIGAAVAAGGGGGGGGGQEVVVNFYNSQFNGSPEQNAEAIEKVLRDRIRRKESKLFLGT